MATFIGIIIAYLLGSLSSAIILAKALKQTDPRETGSGNAGATNVLRSMGKNQAAMVLLGDVLKGFIAILIGMILGVSGAALGLVALATVAGHIFPVFFKFKGGKGAATMLGTMLGLSFFIGLLCIAVWVAIVYVSKYASLASIVSAICAVVMCFLFSRGISFPVFLTAALVIWAHRNNLQRLKDGTESKISF